MTDQTQELGGGEPITMPDDVVRSIVQQHSLVNNATVAKGMDGNPEQAAHALSLERYTGVSAPLVANNYDDFIDRERKTSAQGIVGSNPFLQEYIRSHPLAATVSQDDWAALDEFTRNNNGKELAAVRGNWLHAPLAGADVVGAETLDAIKSGWEGSGLPEGMQDAATRAMDPSQNRAGMVGAIAARLIYGGADTTLKAAGAGMNAGLGALKGGFMMLGEHPEAAQRYAEGLLFGFGSEGAMHGPEEGGKPAPKPSEEVGGIAKHDLHEMRQTVHEIMAPYLAAGEEPPTGLHPEIDAQKAAINAEWVQKLGDDLALAQGAQTRELSQELFSSITARTHGESEIGIHADAVLGLYGDKLPTPDDGLLGWVPGIADQLEAARAHGADVQVPVADWLAKVDPAVHKALADDMRVTPGGITAREAQALPPPGEARQIVNEPLPSLRAGAGLEPKFSMGDRKLSLQLYAKLDPEMSVSGQESHHYNILDENSKPVGEISLIPGPDKKTLYVDWIGGQAGLWANSFGPALVRDIKRQLKAQYPDYEYLTGHRVSGAREGADNFGPTPLPRVRLDAEDLTNAVEDHRKTTEIFQNGWQRFGSTEFNRAGIFTPAELATGEAIRDEIEHLTGGKAQSAYTAGLRQVTDKRPVQGIYQPMEGEKPFILFDLLGNDPQGVGRHESIHALRGYNLITDEEWSALSKAAESEGWLDRYGIEQRYGHLDTEGKIEEAVAEGFREWMGQGLESRPKTGISAIFQKIMDFYEGVKRRLGFEPTASWDEVFAKIKSGEVGAREAGAPREAGAFDIRPKLSVEDERKAVIKGIGNLQAQSIGMDKVHFDKVSAAIRERAEEDLAKAQARAQREQTKRTSDEWKANRIEVLREVDAEIRKRPDVSADLFLGSGEVNGVKMRQRFQLREDAVSPELRAELPDHYVGKTGLDPDHIAGLFGYSSGEDMLRAVAGVNKLKLGEDGTRMRTSDFLRKLTKVETDRRMEMRYGQSARDAMDNAMDEALSKSSVNVSYEEYRAVAESQGVEVYNQAVIKEAAQNLLNKIPVGRLNSAGLFQEMGRHANHGRDALIDGKPAEAVVHMQRQTMTHMMAAMARAKELEIAKFNKDSARWARYKYGKLASSMAPEYANVIQQALKQIGKSVRVPPEYLAREMQESGYGTDMRTFVDDKVALGNVIEPWEELYDPQKTFNFKDLTIEQFDRANDFLRTLVKAGTDEKKLYLDGVATEFAKARDKLKEGLGRLRSVGDGGLGKGARTVNSLLIQMETYIDKIDQWNPNGTWNDYFLRPLFQQENLKMDRVREMVNEIQAITKLKFDNNEIPTIFKNPRNGTDIKATRRTLWAAMLNQGAKDNQLAFAKAWGLKPEDVTAWIDQHAKPEDRAGVQKIWDLLRKTGEWSDDEYRRISDRAMKGIEPQEITAPDGTRYPGGYYPIMHHPAFPGKSANLLGLSEKGLFGSGYSSGFVPGAGYRVDRTGYIAPMALDLDQLPGSIMQQIHDGAMRGTLLQAAKILRDPAIKDAIIEKFGLEVYDGFVTHLRRVANAESPNANLSLSMKRVMGGADYIRRNIISNMIGLNVGTVEKHGPTAFVTSVSQLGIPKMLDAYKDIFLGDEESGASVRKIMYDKSALMRGRQRYFMDSIFGSVGKIHNDNTLISKALHWREWGQWVATQPVALSDAVSAEPLWWGTYKDAKARGHEEGPAVYMADKAVRKAHGAGGEVGQPLIINQVSKWITPMYNFYNSVLNKSVESYWRAGEARRAWKEGDLVSARKNMKAAAVGGFVSLIMPPLIHDIVSPPHTTEDDSWEMRIFKYMIMPYASFVPMGGNIAEYLSGGSSPDFGLQTAAMKQAFDFARDFTHHGKHADSPAADEKKVRDGGAALGWLGLPAGRMLGNWAAGAYGLGTGNQQPQGFGDAWSMLRFGKVPKEQ